VCPKSTCLIQKCCFQVLISTGYAKDEGTPVLQPYQRDQTAVFLMAVGRLRELCARLQSTASYPPSCPAAIIERASLANQRLIVATVGTLADIADAHDVQAPATIVFGDVVRVLHGNTSGLVLL
jgi:siroheme synthase